MAVPKAYLLGVNLSEPMSFYFMCLVLLIVCLILVMNLLRSPTGRAMTAVRDYLDQHPEFQIDHVIDAKLALSSLPNGYLRRVSN